LEKLKGRNHSEDIGVDGNNIKMDLSEVGWKGVGFIWFRMGTSGRLL
jgi:hypothetical protein